MDFSYFNDLIVEPMIIATIKISEAINYVNNTLSDYRYHATKGITTSVILYYLIHNKELGAEISDEEIYDRFDKWLNKNSLGLKNILNSSNGNKYSVDYLKVEKVLANYFCSDAYRYSKHNYKDLVELVNKINSDGINLDVELILLNDFKDSTYVDKMLLLINLIERIILKISPDLKNIGRRDFMPNGILEADIAARGIIGGLVLFSNFNPKIEVLPNNIIVPNRHVVVHKSVLSYNNVDITCDLLINIVYDILLYDYEMYKYNKGIV